ncbi:MAG: MFS transporter [Deltaproteobacteria bacterium]|nr:MFS transporter [Deltaproteobacteria bacterium]
MTDLDAGTAKQPSQTRRGALAVLDNLPVNRFHWRLVFLSGLGWMFDGMDTILLSLVLPVLAVGWQLSPTQVGLVGTVDRFGALCGAALAGLLADRYGRRALFQATLLIYSLGTGLLALTANLSSFLFIRFFVGMGLGGELPVVATLVAEWVPARQRGRLLALLSSFWSYGWILAALMGFLIIPSFGWQAAFLVGALPALYVLVLRRGVPESPRYLMTTGRRKEAIEVLQRMGVKEEILDANSSASLDSNMSRSTVDEFGSTPRIFSYRLPCRSSGPALDLRGAHAFVGYQCRYIWDDRRARTGSFLGCLAQFLLRWQLCSGLRLHS